MPMIETDDGVGLHYRVDGKPTMPPLVLSNSLGTNLMMWDGQVDALARQFYVIRYDPRGHGGSDVPTGEYTLARLAKDALDLLDALEIHRACWCGISMGGMIGMAAATRHPERIGRLALCNTSAYMPPVELWNTRIRTVTKDGMEALADGVVERWFTADFRHAHHAAVERVRAMLLATAPTGYAGCCAAIRDMDLRSEIRGITQPVLILAGANDPATPPAAANEIRASIRHADVVMLDHCAHLSNIEQPEGFMRAVLPFLSADARVD